MGYFRIVEELSKKWLINVSDIKKIFLNWRVVLKIGGGLFFFELILL